MQKILTSALASVVALLQCWSSYCFSQDDVIIVDVTPNRARNRPSEAQKKMTSYSLNSRVSCGSYSDARFASEIIAARLPYVSDNLSLPDACKKEGNNLREKWRQEDIKNIDKIVNNYCSHMNGWVEYNTGECNAGGPPPICPVNHWYRDVQNARKKYQDELNKTLKERAKELKATTCNCWGNSLRNTFQQQNNNTFQALSSAASTKSQNTSSNEMLLPCLNISGSSPCPPDYKCVNGYCVPLTQNQKAKASLGELTYTAFDLLLKDEILEKVLSSFSSTLTKAFRVFSNPYAQGAIAAFTPSSISTNIDGYSGATNRLKQNFTDYHQLLLELNRFYHNRAPARDKKYILNDLASLKNTMYDNYILMNQFHNGILIEQELFDCKDCCEKAFTEYHNQLNNYYSIFSSINPFN